jgi:hypothetical protein
MLTQKSHCTPLMYFLPIKSQYMLNNEKKKKKKKKKKKINFQNTQGLKSITKKIQYKNG